MGGPMGSVGRVLALEAVAAAPTVGVLAFDLRVPGTLTVAVLCLATGYALLRMPDALPVQEGAWLGLGIGGGIGLASAMVTHDVAGVCVGVQCGTTSMLWLRSWLIAVVASSGIGISSGFLAQYDRHHQDLRRRRLTAVHAAGPNRFARLK